MAWKIEFEASAAEEFERLDGSVKNQISKYLKKIEERKNPKSLGEPLCANLASYWKYRVGNYRLVADIQDDRLIILFLVIAHRRHIYKIASKRL